MADTSRTVSDLTTNLFQDSQAAGSITPQDMRDFIETTQNKQGSMYISTAASTTISAQATNSPTVITNMVDVATAATWTLGTGVTANEFDMNTDGQLRYTGTPTINVFFSGFVAIEIDTAAVDKEVCMAVTKNGAVIVGAKNLGFAPATTVNSVPIAVSGIVSMATNDYLGMFIGNIDSTDNITARMGQITAFGLVT